MQILKKIRNKIIGPSIAKSNLNAKKINALEARVSFLESLIDQVLHDDSFYWLYRNRNERMDALVDLPLLFHPVRRKFHLDRYRFAKKYLSQGNVVVDVACGTGYGAKVFEEIKYSKYVGIDNSYDAVEYATKKYGSDRAEFIVSGAEKTGLSTATADIVVSFETLEHIVAENLFLQEIHRLLKPQGLLIISTPNQWPLSIMDHHVKEYDFYEFKNVLQKAGFIIQDIFNQNSGHDWLYNRGQSAGVVKTTNDNKDTAECFIAVCSKA